MKATSMKIFLAIFFLFPLSLSAETISKADIQATAFHRDQLVQQLADKLDAAVASKDATAKELDAEKQAHAQADQALTANQGVVQNLNKQIKAQDARIFALEWTKWKYAIISALISLPVGIISAMVGRWLFKAGTVTAEIAAKA